MLKLVVVEHPPAAVTVALYKPAAIPPLPVVWVVLNTLNGIVDQLTV